MIALALRSLAPRSGRIRVDLRDCLGTCAGGVWIGAVAAGVGVSVGIGVGVGDVAARQSIFFIFSWHKIKTQPS